MTGFVIYCRSFRINAHLMFPLFPENQNPKVFTGNVIFSSFVFILFNAAKTETN